jgi:hypothetical protein
LRPEGLGIRRAAGCHQKSVALVRRTVRQFDFDRSVALPDLTNRRIEDETYAVAFETLPNGSSGVRFFAFEDAVVRVQDRDRTSEALRALSEFESDVAGSDDDQPFR